MSKINIRDKTSISAIAALYMLFILALAGCVSGEVNPDPSEVESPNNAAAQQTPNETPTPSQPASAPTTSAAAPSVASPTQEATVQDTATPVVQVPRISSTPTPTRTPSPEPTERPAVSTAHTPTRTPTPTPVVTDLPVQEQMSEAAFRTLMAAFDSGEIAQERGCLPIPELEDLRAEVIQSTRADVDFDSYSLTGYPLPFILVLDIELTLSQGFFDSTFLFPRSEELPGISSTREQVALINVCSDARIPTTMRVESRDMRWTLYVVTGS